MWIIPKNISDTCPSVAGTKGLDLDSEEFSQMCEKSLMLKSKPSQSATWLRRWKRARYIQHLCSRTLKNSHSESFVDAWTSYLGASPVSPSRQVAQGNQQKIQDTCSRTSSKESKSVSHQLSFSKMLKGLSQPRQETGDLFSSMCSKAWKKWVTEQRQEYSQRVKSVLLTKGSESLSWPTARTSDAEGGRIETELTDKGFRSKRKKSNQWFGAKLRDAVETYENWATPNTMDALPLRSEEALRKQARTTRKGRTRPANLREQVDPRSVEIYKEENWPTPTVAEAGKIGNNPNYGQLGLSNHPKVHGYEVEREPLHKDRKGLPKAGLPDPTKNSTTGKNQGLWNTPKASSGMHPDYQCERDRVTPDLETGVRMDMGYPPLEKSNKGARLNANWVEQLMGLEVGWTQLPIEWID